METEKITKNSYSKYIFVLIITIGIFILALLLSSYIGQKKVNSMKYEGDSIAIDILSLETQFELLQEGSCKSYNNSTLSDKLNELGERLSYSENQKGISLEEVTSLKKYYSILEIKDYILAQKLRKTCNVSPISIIYFYSNTDKCDDCTTQGYVLTRLREKYPSLRVYTFDYNIGVSAVETLISLHKVPKDLPALIINEKVVTKLKTIEEIEKLMPELALSVSTSTATSTNSTLRK